MFPCYFVLASSLAQIRDLPMARRLVVGSIISAAILGGIPFLLARFNRVRLQTGLGLKRPGLVPLLAAAILGLALWPAAHEIFLLSEWLGLSALGTRQFAAAQAMIAQFRTVPLWLIITTMAVLPAVFEELCFRGFLFGALRTRLSGAWTVVASALVFGIFHEILFPGRLLPSTFLGLVLGWVRLRTGSILPGILLHALHNGLLLSIIYHQDELTSRGWGVQEQQHLPMLWQLTAAGVIVASVSLLIASTRRTS
jgi:ABC-2 type transport system permease protein/sodium transport system permease protein